MNERRPMPIAQPGMTAWGRAAERELEAYSRSTALRAPDDLTERVMVAILADAPTRRVPTPSWSPRSMFGRLRMAGGLLAVILMLTMGAALAVAGASTLLQRDNPQPTLDEPDERPIVVVEPSRTPVPDIDEPAPTLPRVVEPPEAPDPNEHKAIEATDPPFVDDPKGPSEATEDPDEDDEPEATDDDDRGGEETDEPDDGGSSGGSSGESGESGEGEG